MLSELEGLIFSSFFGEKTGGFKLFLAIGGGARPSIITNAAAIYVRPKPPTRIHTNHM